MTEPEFNTQLPEHAIRFVEMFPEGRLCRFVNRRSGTLLDVRGDLEVGNDRVPQVVGNPERAGVLYWIITPHGDGQAIIPVPRNGSSQIRYLTPSGLIPERPVTVSPFPASWNILPTADSPRDNPLNATTVPQGLYEEWTCQILWPHYRNGDPRLLDLWTGSDGANTNVVVWPWSGSQWQFWQVQFIRYKPTVDIEPEPDHESWTEESSMELRTPTSIRSVWVENALRASAQLYVRLANNTANPRVHYIGPWIVSQDRRSLDLWELLRRRHIPSGTRFYIGVRTSENSVFATTPLFSLGTSVTLVFNNGFIRGDPTRPLFRLE